MNSSLRFRISALALSALLSACGKAPAPEAVPTPAAAPAAIRIDEAMRERAGLRVEVLRAGTIEETETLYGTIASNAERVRRVVARYPGIAQRVDRAIGDSVRAGERLLSVEANDSLTPYAINSPIAGRVIERDVNAGEAIDGGHTLFVIADLSSVWAELAVYRRDAARIRAGQALRLRPADGGDDVEARIDYIAPGNDPATQTLNARATLANADGRWTPGLYVVADAVLARSEVAVSLPLSAVQTIEGRTQVFVETPQGFVPRVVRLGRQDARNAEVLEGLAVGERVAVGNSFLLKSEWLSTGE